MIRLLQAPVLVLLLCFTVSSQELTVEMHDLDFRSLPRVTFTACVSRGDSLVPPLDGSYFTLVENGVEQIVTLRCPDPDDYNSVILVLDNSGSILGVLPKLVEAGAVLIDNLAANDEAAVLTFNQDPSLRQDFTTDKNLLKSALNGMTANGGTALWDASYRACEELEDEPGRRYAVILTDGQDRNSTLTTIDPIVLYANTIGARLFTIAFGISGSEAALNMKRLAEGTGGRFFDVQRPGELREVYEEIANVITEPCCTGEYMSDNCKDSVRTISLTVEYEGETASTQQTVQSPYRPERMRLSVEVPPSLDPQQSGTGYIFLDPPPDPDLELTLSFVLHYNNDLIDITPPLPLSLGTVTQNQLVNIAKVGPNEMQFTLERIKPAMLTNRLVGFPVQALRSDSSRDVEFVFIDNVQIDGCPTTFDLQPDTTRICLCLQELDVTMVSKEYLTPGENAVFQVSVPSGLVPFVGAELSCEVRIPPEFEVLEVTNGGLFQADALQWTLLPDNWLKIEVPGFSIPTAEGGSLVNIIARAPALYSAKIYELDFRNTRLLQRCCPDPVDPYIENIIVDGVCDKIVRRRAQANISVSPNPVGGARGTTAAIHVSFNASHPGGNYRVILVDIYGQEVLKIADGYFESGNYTYNIQTSSLSSGTYMTVLINDSERVSDTMVIVR